MLKMRLNSIVKVVPKQIECEITILQHKCLPLNKEEIKLAKIVKIVNTKIENNDKEKVIVARKLFSKDIVLTLDFAKAKNHMMKKIS